MRWISAWISGMNARWKRWARTGLCEAFTYCLLAARYWYIGAGRTQAVLRWTGMRELHITSISQVHVTFKCTVYTCFYNLFSLPLLLLWPCVFGQFAVHERTKCWMKRFNCKLSAFKLLRPSNARARSSQENHLDVMICLCGKEQREWRNRVPKNLKNAGTMLEN